MQEWSYIPVGGSLPNTEQRNLAFGAAASMVHPATGKILVVFVILYIKLQYPCMIWKVTKIYVILMPLSDLVTSIFFGTQDIQLWDLYQKLQSMHLQSRI